MVCFLVFATALSIIGGAGFSRAVQASAEDVQRELLSPDTYEEYLPLTSPTDVALCENYKAIADGNTVYVYDVNTQVYSAYTHDEFSQDKMNKVAKLQFDKFQNLYFIDASTKLYRMDKAYLTNASSAEVTDTGLVCSTFVIDDETLYYTRVSNSVTQISKVPLLDLKENNAALLQDDITSNSTLAFWSGELYYTDAGKYIHKLNPEASAQAEPTKIAMFSVNLVSMTVNSGTFACTDENGNFYAYDLSALTKSKDPNEIPTLSHAEGGYSSLSSFGEYIYVAQNNAVTRYAVADQAFDDGYAVCNTSTANNRLSGATETTFVDGILYTADNGNGRISVYDTENAVYNASIQTSLAPTMLASNNQTLLVASATQMALYSLAEENYGEELFAYNHSADTSASITGIAHVYGKYYCATKNNRYFTVEQTQSAEDAEKLVWAIGSETAKTYTWTTESLFADAYGYLYAPYGTAVYRYTETEFLDHSYKPSAPIVDNLPQGTKKLAVDYKRNVYAMTETKMYVCKRNADDSYAPAEEIPLAGSDVYTGATAPTLTAFAFGIEDNLTYLLYDGNYTVISKELSLPTVKQIPVGEVDEQIFSTETAEFTLLKTQKYALFVAFDVNTLNGAEYFPYLSYQRKDAEFTVLKLGSTDEYHLVALFNADTHRYHTYLVLQSSCAPLQTDEYQTIYAESAQKRAWLTNAVALYKFPYLNPLLTATALPRGGEVKLLGEIGGLDHEYYKVSYLENGAEKIGFIPKTYALSYNPLAEKSEASEIGKTDGNTDGVWRLVYILLGLGAICILVDFLILRRREDD